MICSMALELKTGLMGARIKATLHWVEKKALDFRNGGMAVCITVNGP